MKRSLKGTSLNKPETFGKIPDPIDPISAFPVINTNTCSWQLSKFSLVISNRKKGEHNINPVEVTFKDVQQHNNNPQDEMTERLNKKVNKKSKVRKSKNIFMNCFKRRRNCD